MAPMGLVVVCLGGLGLGRVAGPAGPGEGRRTSKWNYAMKRESREVVTSALFTPMHVWRMQACNIVMVHNFHY